jgi:hypothetical protein
VKLRCGSVCERSASSEPDAAVPNTEPPADCCGVEDDGASERATDSAPEAEPDEEAWRGGAAHELLPPSERSTKRGL